MIEVSCRVSSSRLLVESLLLFETILIDTFSTELRVGRTEFLIENEKQVTSR